ncbi:MAG: glycoside hydrolase family 95 protein [Lachnospiraceae bacterium]|nr:glycoside hydrolase family 95 protein [Lachnospiraceae bacterium]
MASNTVLWYKDAAVDFDHALPIGNGRIGGMVYGHLNNDFVGLNEDSVWSGGPRNRNNPSCPDYFPKIRELLLEEKIEEAEKLSVDGMMGVTPNCRHYMPLTDLKFEYSLNEGEAHDYRRDLDLKTAVASVSYSLQGVNYKREYFVSYPDNVLVVHISADKPSSISFKVWLDGRDDYYDDNRPMNSNTIFLSGGCGGEDGICFSTAVRVNAHGGSVSNIGMKLEAKDCDDVTVYVAARTSYYMDNYVMQCITDVDEASRRGYEAVLDRHLEDYQPIFYRSELCLDQAGSEELNNLSTDERIERLRANTDSEPMKFTDNGLVELYYNFGRYLMISGSRPGSLPLNLQGIWNKDAWPAWGGRFTININTEMNYWPVEVTNLSEFHTPLFDLIEKMRPNGRITAREMYDCGGFVAHHNTDLWGDCAPQDIWIPATIWPMGAAWLCLHIFEHYRFTQDKEFLRSKYDTICEAARFFVDYMFEDSHGNLVTGPSVSPENTYLTQSGSKGSMCIGPSMDSEIIFQLFSDCIDAARILDCSDEFTDKLRELRDRLPKPKIGKYGQIQEWAVDYDEVEIGHRHISQLFALYPADQISSFRTPKLAEAARATIERRLSHGGGHTGWSRAWIINFWARLLDGEKVFENIMLLLTRSTNMNMLDSHPPFQIDGNFGATAGIAEAILQSQGDVISLLPALPPQWPQGYVSGLLARGGFEVSISWKNGVLTSAEIYSKSGNTATVAYSHPVKVTCDDHEVPVTVIDNKNTFYTEAGKSYVLEV